MRVAGAVVTALVGLSVVSCSGGGGASVTPLAEPTSPSAIYLSVAADASVAKLGVDLHALDVAGSRHEYITMIAESFDGMSNACSCREYEVARNGSTKVLRGFSLPPGDYVGIRVSLAGRALLMSDGRRCSTSIYFSPDVLFSGGVLHVDESTQDKVTIRIEIPVLNANCVTDGGQADPIVGPLTATATTGAL